MLMSFAAYDLWLHWRRPALFLARQFIDYEPGIHYCQCQMQSGTTGINTLRMYDPTKQGIEHDPQGEFIRTWVPELSRVPLGYLHEPWKMPTPVQRDVGCRIGEDYPLRVVDHATAVREAKAKFADLRGRAEVRRASDGVQSRHGSRRSGLSQVHNGPARSRGKQPSKADAGPGLFDAM
jgi:deoxyribodipyrimidine photo-lyase